MYLNKYEVICLDIQWFLSLLKPLQVVGQGSEENALKESIEYYYDELNDQRLLLAEIFSAVDRSASKKFIVIIDEWAVLICDEAGDSKIRKEYIDFLRSLFKGSHATEFLHLAYLTRIFQSNM